HKKLQEHRMAGTNIDNIEVNIK
ncbi:hypothetical protein, partial [Staphylococcus aureus]